MKQCDTASFELGESGSGVQDQVHTPPSEHKVATQALSELAIEERAPIEYVHITVGVVMLREPLRGAVAQVVARSDANWPQETATTSAYEPLEQQENVTRIVSTVPRLFHNPTN